jgi:hypothetical protein
MLFKFLVVIILVAVDRSTMVNLGHFDAVLHLALVYPDYRH